MSAYWVIKDIFDGSYYRGAGRYPTWFGDRREAKRFVSPLDARAITAGYLSYRYRVVRVVPKRSPFADWERLVCTHATVLALAKRVAVLESQVRSLQSAAPKGVSDLHREGKR